MDAVTLLRQQLEMAHQTTEGTMEGTTPEMAHWMPPGKATPLGASYAHVVLSEDMIVNGMLRQQQPLFATSWAGKTGANEMRPNPGGDWSATYGGWTRQVKVDLPAMRQYAQAVYAETDRYLSTLTPSDLDRVIDLSSAGMGQQTLGWALSMLVVGHINNIAGEISCLKGLQGVRGYPF